jgi:hypothetical protein
MIEHLGGLTLQKSGQDWRIGGVGEIHGAERTGDGDNGHLMVDPYFVLDPYMFPKKEVELATWNCIDCSEIYGKVLTWDFID